MRTTLLTLVLSALLLGCGPTRPPKATPPPEVPAATLGVDDVLSIKVYLQDSLTGDYKVDDRGNLDFPLLGALPVRGMTPAAVADLLEEKLADGYLRNPDVAVDVLEFNSRKISVLGQVREPGRYPFRDGMTLVQAIAEAGGTTETAILAYMQITRTEVETRKQTLHEAPFKDITLGRYPDFYLLPGDVVVVQESVVK